MAQKPGRFWRPSGQPWRWICAEWDAQRFHSDAGHGRPIAEALVEGRQAVYFRSFIDRFAAHPDAIDDADIDVYARGYHDPERLAAGFAMFRSLPLDATDNQAHAAPSAVPILLAFSEYSHATLLPAVRDGLRDTGVLDVRTAVIPGSGHWPAEEQPAALAAIIHDFAVSVTTGEVTASPPHEAASGPAQEWASPGRTARTTRACSRMVSVPSAPG